MKKTLLLTAVILLSVFSGFSQDYYDIELSALPNGAKYEGEAKEAITWLDENGENYFIISIVEEYVSRKAENEYDSEEKTSYLYAYHYIDNGSSLKLSRKITDFVKDCEFDVVLFYEPKSIEVTDLDNDEIYEVSFIYMLSCTSDISPYDMKLMLLENGNKYPVRGTTEINYGDDYIEEGTKKLGTEFSSAPKSFKKFAEEQWNKFNSTTF